MALLCWTPRLPRVGTILRTREEPRWAGYRHFKILGSFRKYRPEYCLSGEALWSGLKQLHCSGTWCLFLFDLLRIVMQALHDEGPSKGNTMCLAVLKPENRNKPRHTP